MYRLIENVMFEYSETDSVIVDLNNGKFYGINGCSARIVECIKKGENTDEIVQKITEKYDVTQEKAMEDVCRFIGVLEEKELIVKI